MPCLTTLPRAQYYLPVCRAVHQPDMHGLLLSMHREADPTLRATQHASRGVAAVRPGRILHWRWRSQDTETYASMLRTLRIGLGV